MNGKYKIFLNGKQMEKVVAAKSGEDGFIITEGKDYKQTRISGRVQVYYHCDCGAIHEYSSVNLK